MDLQLRPCKGKKFIPFQKGLALPIIINKNGDIKSFTGSFNGFAVIVSNMEAIELLQNNGAFGKANLSRNWLSFCGRHEVAEIIRERQFLNRNRYPKIEAKKKIIVVRNSDTEDEEYVKSIKPRYELDCTGFKEILQLSLVEAFFLYHDLKCLTIETELKDSESIWQLFSDSNKYFIQDYIAYYHFRSKNWVVKPGIKFGGDLILYKDGPAFTHASYVVLIEVINEQFCRNVSETRRSMDFTSLVGLNRLCETAGKELLIFQIILPENLSISEPRDIRSVTVNEVLIRRWLSNLEQQNKVTKPIINKVQQ